METLFLRFLVNSEARFIDEDASLQWVLASDSVDDENCGKIKLAHAASLIQDRKVVILLPIEDIFLTHVELHIKNRKQLEKAVPFALEDELAEDIEELHFAIGSRNADDQYPVAVISKAKLDHLIKVLGEVNIYPDIITIDIFGLQWKANQWSACIDDDHVLVRTKQWSGFACDVPSFLEFINIASAGEENRPELIDVYAHPDENIDDLKELPNFYVHDFWRPNAYVEGFQEDKCINLLQGSYIKADKQHKTIRPWKIAAALTGIWLALLFTQVGVEYSQLNKADNQLSTKIESVFRNTFPEVNNVVNPRVQMEQRLKKLREGGNSTSTEPDFLKLLHHSGYELNKDKNVAINSIRFRNSELSLEVDTKDVQVLENVKTKLSSKNLTAQLQSANSIDDIFRARMVITE